MSHCYLLLAASFWLLGPPLSAECLVVSRGKNDLCHLPSARRLAGDGEVVMVGGEMAAPSGEGRGGREWVLGC